MAPGPIPKRPKRLNSLKNAAPGSRPKPNPNQQPAKQLCCESPLVEDDSDGRLICKNCYTLISESNIVSDVTFQEDSRGAATVQGGYVSEQAGHARTSAAMRRMGGGEKNVGQDAAVVATRAMSTLGPRLGVPQAVRDQAVKLYQLVIESHNFAAGRRTDEVIGACLYAACRRQKDNAVLLIDIAEIQRLNVFRLGEVYKCMCQELYLDQGSGGGVGTQYLLEVESLIMKYCRRLEFEGATRQVAEDAVKIIRRMKRDWILTGRHPAGLCGAAIILAARMNNFHRSVREMVYVAKVADLTISRRVDEFRRTKSAALTVDQFREFGVRLKYQHDPPILYESELKKQKFEEKKRKRKEDREGKEVVEIEDDVSSRESSVATPTPTPDGTTEDGPAPRKRRRTSAEQQVTPTPTQQEVRRDADGFVIPPLPIDPATAPEETEDGGKQDGRTKRHRRKKEAPEPIVITEEELETEAELEFDINDALNDQEIVDSRNELEKAKDEERAKLLADRRRKIDDDKLREQRMAEGITWLNDHGLTTEVSDEELMRMFEEDPEVMNCCLTTEEATIKEQIWIKENEDWMRRQHEKSIIELIASAQNRNPNGKRKNKKSGKTLNRKRKGKMGDGTTLREAEAMGTPVETPADASAAMLDVRAPGGYSKWIDYETLRRVYAPSSSSRTSRTPSVSGGGNGDGGEGSPGSGEGEGSPTPAARGSGGRNVRILSPPVTQLQGRRDQSATPMSTLTPSPSPAPRRGTQRRPLSPPQTQSQQQASAGADDVDDEEEEGDESDFVQNTYSPDDEEDGLDYGEDGETGGGRGGLAFGGDDDDREDIGEDDYRRAIDPMGDLAMDDYEDGEEGY